MPTRLKRVFKLPVDTFRYLGRLDYDVCLDTGFGYIIKILDGVALNLNNYFALNTGLNPTKTIKINRD